MYGFLTKLPEYEIEIESIKDSILTNIILTGDHPSITFKEKNRSSMFLQRLSETGLDEVTTDGYRNPIGIMRGTSPTKPPIMIVAHLDDAYQGPIFNIDQITNRPEFLMSIESDRIFGPGVTDNSAGVGVLLSLPEIFRHLNLNFESDIILAGVIQSLGKGNMRGIRHLLKTWPTKIRGGICLEAIELGRLNYFSQAMIRLDIECRLESNQKFPIKNPPNLILILTEVINAVLAIKMPKRPKVNVIFSNIYGGMQYGKIAKNVNLGIEIKGESNKIITSIYNEITDICKAISHEFGANIIVHSISRTRSSRLKYKHPLIKSAFAVFDTLKINPVAQSSESELSIFLTNNIPAITLGITYGEELFSRKSYIDINAIPKGIAQIIGIIMAIDNGVCDE